jgi:hypothetical protein
MDQSADAGESAAAVPTVTANRLFQRIVDRGEFGVELRADALDRGDDRKGDTSGDQTIFDRCRTGLIAQESENQPTHPKLLLPTPAGSSAPVPGAKLSPIGCEGVDEHAEQSIKTIAEFSSDGRGALLCLQGLPVN